MTNPERSVDELDQLILAHITIQSGFHAGVNSVGDVDEAVNRIKNFFHQELQKAREEERERISDWLKQHGYYHEEHRALFETLQLLNN